MNVRVFKNSGDDSLRTMITLIDIRTPWFLNVESHDLGKALFQAPLVEISVIYGSIGAL